MPSATSTKRVSCLTPCYTIDPLWPHTPIPRQAATPANLPPHPTSETDLSREHSVNRRECGEGKETAAWSKQQVWNDGGIVSSRGKGNDELLAACGGHLFSLRVQTVRRPASLPPTSTAASDLTAAQYVPATNRHCDIRNDNLKRNQF